MREHQHKLPFILALATFVLALGWSAADARQSRGLESDSVVSGQWHPKVEVASGEPDQPKNDGGNSNGNGTKASRHADPGSDLSRPAGAWKAWVSLFWMRFFAP